MITTTDNPNEQPDKKPPLSAKEKAAQKIHDHLLNKNDMITDEDIKNMPVATGAENTETKTVKDAVEKENKQNQDDDDDAPPTISSWNILSP